MVKIGAIL